MGFTLIFVTMCLYLAWFTWPVKSLSFQEVFRSEEISTKAPAKPNGQCNKNVHGIGSNENNLYLHKVLNKKVLNNFAMVKKQAFYITPPFEARGKVTTYSHGHAGHAAADNHFKKDILEQFTMKRKEAFYITPPFDNDALTPETDTELPDESSDNGSKENNFHQEEHEEKQENHRAQDKHNVKSVPDVRKNQGATEDQQEKPKPVIDAQDLKNSAPKIANGSVKPNDTDKVAAKSYDYDITFKPFANNIANRFVSPRIRRNQAADSYQQDIADLTKKQAEILNQLSKVGGDKDKVDVYNQKFNDLMQAIQQQKAWASSTVIIMLDETEVKKKLRGDPFVQRVLKMAQRRKEEYFKRAQAEALKNLP